MSNWRAYEAEKRVWEKANRPATTTKKAKLFTIGGDKVSPQSCPFITLIVSDGLLIDLPITLREATTSAPGA